MAKNGVDGVYDADPALVPTATKYSTLKYMEAIERELKVMDTTALSLCMDNRLPLIVFDINRDDNLERLVRGEAVGTSLS
jgi:uridylate kinase